jgi:hypothetical protein
MGFRKNQTPPNFNTYDPQEYRTGSTAPQKSHRGLIAVLFVAVIILGGAVSILGIMNVQLFRQLAKDHAETLPYSLFNTDPSHEVASAESSPLEVTASLFPEDMEPSVDHGNWGRGDDLQGSPTSEHIQGFQCEPVSPFNQHYYQLPQGLHITEVAPGSYADAIGFRQGDILLAVNGIQFTQLQYLQKYLSICSPDTTLVITLYRDGETITLHLNLS